MNHTCPNREHILIQDLKAGNQEAFNQLFYLYQKKLFYFSYKLLQSEVEAEEIVQEVFIKVWEHRESMKEWLSFDAYIIKIGRNLIYNKAKRRVNEFAYQAYLKKYAPFAQSTTENDINVKALEEITGQFIAAMPPQRQTVFKLSRRRGLSNKEIATRLNISPSTVENHLNKALKSLRHYLYHHDVDVLFVIIGFLLL